METINQIIPYAVVVAALGILAWNLHSERKQTNSLVSTITKRLNDPAKQLVIDELPDITENIKVWAKESATPYDDMPAEILDQIADRVVARLEQAVSKSVESTAGHSDELN